MKSLQIDFSTALVSEGTIHKTYPLLNEKIKELQAVLRNDHNEIYDCLLLPAQTQALNEIIKLATEKKKLTPTVLIIIGIGGSNLSTIAIQEALLGKLYNEHCSGMRIYYADTVDSLYIKTIYRIAEQALQKKECVFLTIITKSGTTTETIANAQIFLGLLQQYYPKTYSECVVVITEQYSPLWNIALKKNFSLLAIPKSVGGRYSVFSAVGLFPLAMLAIDITELLQGAYQELLKSLQDDMNNAVVGAIIKYIHYKNGVTINDFFTFCPSLESLGKWHRQLIAESLGKKSQLQGSNVGIMPTVSVGSIDLHSIGQLYLAGPRDKFVTFISCVNDSNTMTVPKLSSFASSFNSLQEKSLPFIMESILSGVKTAYQKEKRPFCSLVFPQLTGYYIGQFMQMSMLETVYLAHLLNVNPFDQPDVELYKQETRKILSHE